MNWDESKSHDQSLGLDHGSTLSLVLAVAKVSFNTILTDRLGHKTTYCNLPNNVHKFTLYNSNTNLTCKVVRETIDFVMSFVFS